MAKKIEVKKARTNLIRLSNVLGMASGEINFTTEKIPEIIDAVKNGFTDAASKDEIDGMSVWYPTYWFNIRASKTEPVIRLNVEADTKEILDTKTKELMEFMTSKGAVVK